jgi:hypothetical protein
MRQIAKADSHLTFLLEGAKLLGFRNVEKFRLIAHFTSTSKGVHRLKRVVNRDLCIVCRKRKVNITYKTCVNIDMCIGDCLKKVHFQKSKKYLVLIVVGNMVFFFSFVVSKLWQNFSNFGQFCLNLH